MLKPLGKDELIDALNKLETSSYQVGQLDLLNYNLQNTDHKRIALANQEEILFVDITTIV